MGHCKSKAYTRLLHVYFLKELDLLETACTSVCTFFITQMLSLAA